MVVRENDIFKMISFRKPIDGLTIEPTEDIPNSAVVKLLADMQVIPDHPNDEVLARLQDQPTLTESDLNNLALHQVVDLLQNQPKLTFAQLKALRLHIQNHKWSLETFSGTELFADNYRQVVDSWLVLKLKQGDIPLIEQHEALIRAAHLCLRLRVSPGSLKNPETIANLRQALIILPKPWRTARYLKADLQQKHTEKLLELKLPEISDKAQKIAEAEANFKALERKIAHLESLQTKAYRTYHRYKHQPQIEAAGGNARSLAAAGIITTSVPLDEGYYTALDNALSDEERDTLNEIVGPGLDTRPATFTDLVAELDYADLVVSSNDACSQIKVFEVEEKAELPAADAVEETEDRPSVRAIGWGDLIVARERLVRYDAQEIAHIENVLAGEEKVREHERTKTTQEFTETETIEETESERDLQTSDRYELQSESQKTINQEFSVEAGVNTSGRYGLTKIETSLDVGFQQSKSESKNSSNRLAKEIVNRVVERTFESVRRLRRLTITEQIRELNTHALRNVATDGAPAVSQSGVYLWVEKVHEVQLRHYGTRLMVEFHVPEPAVSLLEQSAAQKKKIPKPAPLTIGPADVKESNYLCLTRLYGAEDVEPPPLQFVQVGWAWASTPNEDDNANTSEDTVGEMISIPANYIPISGRAMVSAHPAHPEDVDVFLGVAGIDVINLKGEVFDRQVFDFDPEDTWPQGVPVSVRAHGHFDKTLTAQVTMRCKRTEAAYKTWQIQTWEKIRQAHQLLVEEYNRAVEEEAFAESALFQIQGRPEADTQRLEQEELKKWAIKIIRHPHHFQFNAIEQVGDYQEIAPLGADFQAPIVRFFEEAFEWRQMSYFLYPYYWGRRDAWKLRQGIDIANAQHESFLRAGAARVIVPVTPNYEARVLHYLESNEDNEYKKILGPEAIEAPADSDVEDLWLELLIQKNEELALGSGTLSVKKNKEEVEINPDSDWLASDRDLGRELYIDGGTYRITAVLDDRHFSLEGPFQGETDANARYATGSVPYGAPWLVRLPTNLVILLDEKGKLEQMA
ncbi:MAG: hypothetical protein IPM53_08985 [Anaerolineaceae bacterium]|nr:hypothetical protein [Anaerolineaceae bacterium]